MQVRRLNNQISIRSLSAGFLVSYFNLLLYQEKIPFNQGNRVFWIKLSRINCNPTEIIVLKISPGIPPIIPNSRFPKLEVPNAVTKVKALYVIAEAILPEFNNSSKPLITADTTPNLFDNCLKSYNVSINQLILGGLPCIFCKYL